MPTSWPGPWSTSSRAFSTAHKKGPTRLRAPGLPRYATRGKLSVSRRDGEKGKTPSDEGLMPDPHATFAERQVQHSFMKSNNNQRLVMAATQTERQPRSFSQAKAPLSDLARRHR